MSSVPSNLPAPGGGAPAPGERAGAAAGAAGSRAGQVRSLGVGDFVKKKKWDLLRTKRMEK